MYHCLDQECQSASAAINIYLLRQTKFAPSARQTNCLNLVNSLLKNYLAEHSYHGECTNLYCKTYVRYNHLEMTCSGFDDTLPLFICNLSKMIR